MFDFQCGLCETVFEELVPSDVRQVKCPHCDMGHADRQISPVRSDWRNMGVSNDFPTAAGKWERMQRQKARPNKREIEEETYLRSSASRT